MTKVMFFCQIPRFDSLFFKDDLTVPANGSQLERNDVGDTPVICLKYLPKADWLGKLSL